MEQRVTTYSQYAISSNVNGIRDIEAETVNGISVQKIYFQPDVNLEHLPDRCSNELDPRTDADRDRAAGGCAIQRFGRAGAADKP